MSELTKSQPNTFVAPERMVWPGMIRDNTNMMGRLLSKIHWSTEKRLFFFLLLLKSPGLAVDEMISWMNGC